MGSRMLISFWKMGRVNSGAVTHTGQKNQAAGKK